MKKRTWILLLAIILLLVPHVASANSPVRRPELMRIECENMTAGTRMDVVLFKADGSKRTMEDLYRSYGEGTTGYVYFMHEDGETSFYLKVIAPDGTETASETVQIVAYGAYRYDGAENRLESTGAYYSRAQSCGDGIAVIAVLLLLLVLPLGLTLLFEFLTALCFGIRPKKYVFIINLITNPVMNVLLIVLTLSAEQPWVYWAVLAVLELLVIGLEFLFYTKKYRETSRIRLFAFTLTANLVSFAAGVALAQLLL
jgi:hypothetical protein